MRGRGHMTWYPWIYVYKAIATQRLSLPIQVFRPSAALPYMVKSELTEMLTHV
jgi:hypothetical protein